MKKKVFIVLAMLLIGCGCRAMEEEYEPSSRTRLLKKGLYLTAGVGCVSAGGLTWALSSDTEYIRSWLNWLVLPPFFSAKQEEFLAKCSRYYIALRCLSIALFGTGAFCLTKALAGDLISPTLKPSKM